jgi:hypothetical protein
MKKAFYSSLFIHLVVFIFISITLPEIKTKEIDYISVEIIHEKIKKLEKIKEVEEVEKIKEIKNIIEVKEVKNIEINPAPPKEKPNILPKIEESIKITEKIDIKPKVPIKKPEIKINNEKVKKPEIKINNEKIKKVDNIDKSVNNDDFFDDMLKNLAENQPNPVKPKQEIKAKTITKSARTNEDKIIITNSIVNSIWKQIIDNYTIPPAQDLMVNKIIVQLRIHLRQDGSISKIIVKETSLKKAKSDPSYLPYVEAAQRAIRKVGKFKKLPQKDYDLWDIIDINFTPFKT